MKSKTTVYWVTTGLFCAMLGLGGAAYLLGAELMVENMARLGYPPYFLIILGTAKLLGVAALLAPGRALLKEWAYAGFAFDLIGAVASHSFAGDPFSETVRPAVVLLIGVASYLTRPSERRLAASPVLGAAPVAAEASGATSRV